MPEQQGSRHLPPTSAPIEHPFETAHLRLGVGGLDLRLAGDNRDPAMGFLKFKNVVHQNDGQLVGRPGTVALTTHADDIHSIKRMDDVEAGDYTRIWGVGTSLGFGKDTVITEVDSGYSGTPLSLVPYRPPLSGDPWLFVGNNTRTRKIRFDGLDLQIGLTPPADSIVAVQDSIQQTSVIMFDTGDGTQASAWTGTSGFDYSDDPQPTTVPVTFDYPGVVGSAVKFLAQDSTTNDVFNNAKGYYSFWSMPLVRDLSVVGSLPASDEDLFHIWIKLTHPDKTTEVRLYFVVSDGFSTGVLPGNDFTGVNNDFYVKAWRMNDFAQYIMANTAEIEASETARINAVRTAALKERATNDLRPSWTVQREQVDPVRSITDIASAGREQWLEYGIIGVPVKRGDFLRVGSTSGRDWSTITGVVVFIQTSDGTGGAVSVIMDDCYLYGGSGPDTSEPGAQQYDWRYTHYDPRTGAESNPSPEQDEEDKLDLPRTSATLTPVAYGDSAIRQRFWRRGGSLIEDWFFLGENESDGGSFSDNFTDDSIAATDPVELDNDAFVTTVDDAGDTVHEQPLPIIFGPSQDLLFALGDPHRPGDVYFCKPGRPDSWPPDFHVEVCPPSEELMSGGVFAGQPFVLSRERGYLLQPNLTGTTTTVTATPTACMRGLVGRWAMAIGRGFVWFVSRDGIFRTNGGEEVEISEMIRPLFQGKTVEGLFPVDTTADHFLRLALHEFDLIFHYKDTQGTLKELRYSTIYNFWREVERPGIDIKCAYSDEGGETSLLLLGGETIEKAYYEGGTTDDGAAIAAQIRTSNFDFSRPREDKLLGDAFLDADRKGINLTVTPYLNHEASTAQALLVDSGSDRQRYVLAPFGTDPIRARTVAWDITWSASAAPPILYQVGTAVIPEPDVTTKRVTQWDDIGSPDEKYLTGCWIECDTQGQTRTVLVEGDLNGSWFTVATLTINSNQRHRFPFSWPVQKVNQVRLRPDDCIGWILYRLDWISQPEPPRIARWDINYENNWDNYLTGLDLDCDTFGAEKTIQIFHDQDLVGTYPVTRDGRGIVHLTVQPPVRGHLLRFTAIDDNPGLLYAHRWHQDEEPSEQTNWNQNYTVAGFMTDKWLKGVVFECDTFAQDKSVTVEVDGVVVETLVVNTDGRKVVEFSFPQHLGRVFRILPTDNFPSRLYQPPQLIFDLEPFSLTRWETQELDFDHHLWSVPLYGQITIKSTQDVNLQVTVFDQDGTSTVDNYTITSTAGQKVKKFVPFVARKGALFKFVMTSAAPFWLYREESALRVTLWGTGETKLYHIFGNDDLDRTRGMTNAALAAARPGGGT